MRGFAGTGRGASGNGGGALSNGSAGEGSYNGSNQMGFTPAGGQNAGNGLRTFMRALMSDVTSPSSPSGQEDMWKRHADLDDRQVRERLEEEGVFPNVNLHSNHETKQPFATPPTSPASTPRTPRVISGSSPTSGTNTGVSFRTSQTSSSPTHLPSSPRSSLSDRNSIPTSPNNDLGTSLHSVGLTMMAPRKGARSSAGAVNPSSSSVGGGGGGAAAQKYSGYRPPAAPVAAPPPPSMSSVPSPTSPGSPSTMPRKLNTAPKVSNAPTTWATLSRKPVPVASVVPVPVPAHRQGEGGGRGGGYGGDGGHRDDGDLVGGQQPREEGYSGGQQPREEGYSGGQQPREEGYSGGHRRHGEANGGYRRNFEEGHGGYRNLGEGDGGWSIQPVGRLDRSDQVDGAIVIEVPKEAYADYQRNRREGVAGFFGGGGGGLGEGDADSIMDEGVGSLPRWRSAHASIYSVMPVDLDWVDTDEDEEYEEEMKPSPVPPPRRVGASANGQTSYRSPVESPPAPNPAPPEAPQPNGISEEYVTALLGQLDEALTVAMGGVSPTSSASVPVLERRGDEGRAAEADSAPSKGVMAPPPPQLLRPVLQVRGPKPLPPRPQDPTVSPAGIMRPRHVGEGWGSPPPSSADRKKGVRISFAAEPPDQPRGGRRVPGEGGRPSSILRPRRNRSSLLQRPPSVLSQVRIVRQRPLVEDVDERRQKRTSRSGLIEPPVEGGFANPRLSFDPAILEAFVMGKPIPVHSEPSSPTSESSQSILEGPIPPPRRSVPPVDPSPVPSSTSSEEGRFDPVVLGAFVRGEPIPVAAVGGRRPSVADGVLLNVGGLRGFEGPAQSKHSPPKGVQSPPLSPHRPVAVPVEATPSPWMPSTPYVATTPSPRGPSSPFAPPPAPPSPPTMPTEPTFPPPHPQRGGEDVPPDVTEASSPTSPQGGFVPPPRGISVVRSASRGNRILPSFRNLRQKGEAGPTSPPPPVSGGVTVGEERKMGEDGEVVGGEEEEEGGEGEEEEEELNDVGDGGGVTRTRSIFRRLDGVLAEVIDMEANFFGDDDDDDDDARGPTLPDPSIGIPSYYGAVMDDETHDDDEEESMWVDDDDDDDGSTGKTRRARRNRIGLPRFSRASSRSSWRSASSGGLGVGGRPYVPPTARRWARSRNGGADGGRSWEEERGGEWRGGGGGGRRGWREGDEERRRWDEDGVDPREEWTEGGERQRVGVDDRRHHENWDDGDVGHGPRRWGEDEEWSNVNRQHEVNSDRRNWPAQFTVTQPPQIIDSFVAEWVPPPTSSIPYDPTRFSPSPSPPPTKRRSIRLSIVLVPAPEEPVDSRPVRKVDPTTGDGGRWGKAPFKSEASSVIRAVVNVARSKSFGRKKKKL
ncbi:hypothetical protein HDU67_004181 [Dinochytrium kinnereticum]|nr:hypothetical protein HDU67_004181 [Dinochytrium kinnereticum]